MTTIKSLKAQFDERITDAEALKTVREKEPLNWWIHLREREAPGVDTILFIAIISDH